MSDLTGIEKELEDALVDDEAYLDEEEGILELVDEEGNTQRFEFVDKAELNGTVYYALIPFDGDGADGEDEDTEFVVLKETDVDGEKMLASVDDDAEYGAVGEMFIQRFSELADAADYDE